MSEEMMLTLDGVTYRWPGSQRVFGPVSAQIPSGKWVALIGPNGSGKSTLLRLVAAYWSKLSGRITVAGRALESLTPHERAQLLAHVPQGLETSFDLTVREVVELGRINRLSWRDRLGFGTHDAELVDRVLGDTEMVHLADRAITTLSGGEARRALLAAALAQQAPILLLDEPTAHLDPGHALKFLEMVRKRVDTGSVTVLMAYHDLATVSLYADELWVMNEGQLVLTGTSEDVLANPLLQEIYHVDLVTISHPRTHKPLLIFP